MNHEASMEFLKLAKSIVKTEEGEVSEDSLPYRLIEMAQKAIQAYHEYTGQPLDVYMLGVLESY